MRRHFLKDGVAFTRSPSTAWGSLNSYRFKAETKGKGALR